MKAETAYLRLEQFLKAKKIKPSPLEIKLGLSNARIANIFRRKTIVDAALLEILSHEYPDLNKGWILWEEGEMLKPPAQNTQLDSQEEKPELLILQKEIMYLKEKLSLADECTKEARRTISKMEKLEGALERQIELLEDKLNNKV